MKFFAVLLTFLIAPAAYAQNNMRLPQGWSLGLAAGGAAFTDFQRTELQATRLGPTGLTEQENFPRRVGAQTTGTIAGNLSFWPSSSWGLRFYGTYSPSRFQTVVTRSAAQFMGMPRLSSDSTKLASLQITSMQLQTLFRLPVIHGKVMPYGIVGAGQAAYTVGSQPDSVPVEVRGQLDSGTRRQFAGTLGAGAMLQTRRAGLELHFEMIDRVSRTPIREGPVHVLNALSFTIGLSWRVSSR